MIEACYYEHENGRIRCLLCPNYCLIEEGKNGRCLARGVENGRLFARSYGQIVSASCDPIEKKPLYHVFPGKRIFSIGSYGCNLSCRFCQNFEISQNWQPGMTMSPEKLAETASRQSGNVGVAFTYNEPGIWYEYVTECATVLHAAGHLVVLITNGYLSEEPWQSLCRCTDAMNIDLKSFNPGFYREICGGRLETVKNNIIAAIESGVHVELTHLVVTGLNDREDEFSQMVDWVSGISDEIVLHISRYFPRYQETAPPTDPQTIYNFVLTARKKLKYVYAGNIEGDQNTVCPSCGATWVSRDHYKTIVLNSGKHCKCGLELPFLMHMK